MDDTVSGIPVPIAAALDAMSAGLSKLEGLPLAELDDETPLTTIVQLEVFRRLLAAADDKLLHQLDVLRNAPGPT